jgi:hypothetical protein
MSAEETKQRGVLLTTCGYFSSAWESGCPCCQGLAENQCDSLIGNLAEACAESSSRLCLTALFSGTPF